MSDSQVLTCDCSHDRHALIVELSYEPDDEPVLSVSNVMTGLELSFWVRLKLAFGFLFFKKNMVHYTQIMTLSSVQKLLTMLARFKIARKIYDYRMEDEKDRDYHSRDGG